MNASKVTTIVIPGDLHLTSPDLENHRIANWVVTQANTLIHPNFVQFIGDNVQDATTEQFQLFRQLADRLETPWYALVGDHDVHGDPTAKGFQDAVGRPWGSVVVNCIRFLRLNTQEAKPVGISDAQLQWLHRELQLAQQNNERVVIFQHNYAYQIWEEFDGPGIDDLRALLQTYRLEAIICGHTHYWQVANDGRNIHIAVRSIGDPEGGPAGYAIVCFADEDWGCIYRTPGDSGPIVLILRPHQRILCKGSQHVVSGEFEVLAKIWSASRVVTAAAQIDDGISKELCSCADGLWRREFDSEALTKGKHFLKVVAEDEEGRVSEQSIDFVVDQTGRYTAIPCVEPVVETTQFC